VEKHVSASTQNQAMCALLFLYRDVLKIDNVDVRLGQRAKRPERLPVVLTKQEVRSILERMTGTSRLVSSLLYGAGLRLLECLTLRIKDLDFTRNEIVIRDGKGQKDRVTMLPDSAKDSLKAHLLKVKALHDRVFSRVLAKWCCRMRSSESIRMRPENGAGNGFFLPRVVTLIAWQESSGGTTCTNR